MNLDKLMPHLIFATALLPSALLLAAAAVSLAHPEPSIAARAPAARAAPFQSCRAAVFSPLPSW